MSTRTILEEIERTRSPIGMLRAPESPGVYAVFIKENASLPLRVSALDGLIYIGRSTNLSDRQYGMHFSSERTGFSTLRRSIGALLKDTLALRAIPRGPGKTDSNCRCYRFQPDGEERLSAWMRDNVEVGVCALSADWEGSESELISELKPVLCLKGWDNPHARLVKELRKQCADEARGKSST